MDPRLRWQPSNPEDAMWIGATEHFDVYCYPTVDESTDAIARWSDSQWMFATKSGLAGAVRYHGLPEEEVATVLHIVELFMPKKESRRGKKT